MESKTIAMQENASITFKCLAFNKVFMESHYFEFIPDQEWREHAYFTVDGRSIKINMNGAWTCVVRKKLIQKGVHHFSIKVKTGTQILPGFVTQDQTTLLNPMHQVKSYNAFYIHDGSTRSEGVQRYSNVQVPTGEIIHAICDMNNGVITFLRASTGETLGQTFVPAVFKGKPMKPLIYFKNKGDEVQIVV